MHRTRLELCLAAAIGVLLLASPRSTSGQEVYEIIDLGSLDPTYPSAYPYAINNAGDVAGVAPVLAGSIVRPTAFLWRGGAMQGLAPGAYYSWAYGLNDRAEAVGGVTPASRVSPSHAAILTPDGVSDLHPFLDGVESVAFDINDSGQVVGARGSVLSRRAFLVDGGTMVDLHEELAQYVGGGVLHLVTQAMGINRAGVIVGSYGTGATEVAFVRHPDGTYETLDPGLNGESAATCINDDAVVGGAAGAYGAARPIVWDGPSVTDLGALGTGFFSRALGINSRGDIVGSSHTGGFDCSSVCFPLEHAFLYQGGVMSDLNDLIPVDSGWELISATGINDSGQIAARAMDAQRGQRAVLLTPSPRGRLGSLIDLVLGLELPGGIENSLVKKLENARAALEDGDTATACELLGAFVNECEAQSGKKLAADDAARLIGEAQAIRALLGCS